MKIQQLTLTGSEIDPDQLAALAALAPNLVFVFAAPSYFLPDGAARELGRLFPVATLIGCSTAGEVSQSGVHEGSAVITAIRLEKSRITSGTTQLLGMADSRAAGQRLANKLLAPDLVAVVVFGPGVSINGSALVEGMAEILGKTFPLSGGLAGDNGAFVQTWTMHNGDISDHAVVAVGFAGDELQIRHGSFGGWQTFGPARLVTRCESNVLFELDGEPALETYKRYLGDYAKDLPASGLLFPFAMLEDDLSATGLTRTILGIDEAAGSVTLAGEIYQGRYVKLMHSSTEGLLDGAEMAARAVLIDAKLPTPALALLVSCVGRKLAMGDRVEEEVEAVSSILGEGTVCTGYYSNGEISPFAPSAECKLHNQTMTITTISEI